MQFIETILPTFRVWQLFCLSPFALTKKTRWPTVVRPFNVFCIAYLAIESAILVHGFIFTGYYLDWERPVVIVYGDLITMTLARALGIVAVIESWKKRSIQIGFLEKIAKVDVILTYRLNIDPRYDANRREILWKSMAWLMSFMALQVYVITSILIDDNDPMFFHFWLVYMMPFFICSLRYHQMTTYVRLVRFRFEAINDFIQNVCFLDENRVTLNRDLLTMMKSFVKTIPASSPFEDNKMGLYHQLIEVRNAYQMLYDASEDINTLFRWTLPINIANDFQKGLTNIFFFITLVLKWDSGSNLNKIFGPLTWAVFNIGHIMILSSACQNACEEAELTPALLHQIDFSLSDQQLADLVRVDFQKSARDAIKHF